MKEVMILKTAPLVGVVFNPLQRGAMRLARKNSSKINAEECEKPIQLVC